MSNYPEINLARRVVQKYQIKPPADILELARAYAKVQILSLPVDIDGISAGLKVPKKQPTIVLNEQRPPRRRRFTLAHELGHVLIPWHIGVIADEIDFPHDFDESSSYWILEGEANRFAAELLMPQQWINELIVNSSIDNPCELLKIISDTANVSMDAAIIKLVSSLRAGYLYMLLDANGRVKASGVSPGTVASRPTARTQIDLDTSYTASDQRWELRHRNELYVWWHFPQEIRLPEIGDAREWREILDNIVNDLHLSAMESRKLKQTVNGIVSYANSSAAIFARRNGVVKTPEAVYSASIQRFDSRVHDEPILRRFINHFDFHAYLSNRIQKLCEK